MFSERIALLGSVISVQFAFKAFTINREQGVRLDTSFKKDSLYISFLDAIKLLVGKAI